MLNTAAFSQLLNHYHAINKLSLSELFAQDEERANKYTLNVNGIGLDFSKNNINDETLYHLIHLANESGIVPQIEAMFSGEKINNTENRAVLHTALRAAIDSSKTLPQVYVDGSDVIPEIAQVLQQTREFSEKLHNSQHLGYTGQKITDIVNIGIGGSDLGPVLICQALKPYRKNNLNIHFISSVDGYQILDVLDQLDPATTLFIIASKTFTTLETLTNANTAREWFLQHSNNNLAAIKQHFVAVSTNREAVTKFGISLENMFCFWDFVGGRYSLWSAIGLSIIVYIGFDNFSELLSGAAAMDQHFRHTTNLRHNMPVLLALIGIWYINFYDYNTQIISPYNTRLTRFPAYIQQLEMESNGKAVDKYGNQLSYKTCPVVWGDSGINGQHAYYQLLHQGTSICPMDIILALADKFSNKEHNQILQASAIAQAEAFMVGRTYEVALQELLSSGISHDRAEFLAKHKTFRGNRPTNMIILPEISPYYLGNLIALYEHKTFVQGIIWNINSFDQWGVELGKQLTQTVLSDIKSGTVSPQHDNSTIELIKRCWL